MNIGSVIAADFGRTGNGRKACSKSVGDLIYSYCTPPNAGIIPKVAFERITQNPERKMKQLANSASGFCSLSEDGNEIVILPEYMEKINKLHEEFKSIYHRIDLRMQDTIKVGINETPEGIILDERFEYVRFYHYITDPKNETNFIFNNDIKKEDRISEINVELLRTIRIRITHDIVKFHFIVTKQLVCPRCSTINVLSQSLIESVNSIKCMECKDQSLQVNKFKPKDILPYYLYEGAMMYSDGKEEKLDIESFTPLLYGTYYLQGYFQTSKHNPFKFVSLANKRYTKERQFTWVKDSKNIYINFIKSIQNHAKQANLPLYLNKALLPVYVEALKIFMHALSDGTFTIQHSFYLTGPDVGKTYPIEVVNSIYYNNVPDMTIDASRFTIPGLTGTTYEYKIQGESITLFVPGALSREFILWEEMMNEQFLNPKTKDNPQELIKSIILKDAGNVAMKGGEKFDRNAIISAAGNHYDQHISEYKKIVNKYFRRIQRVSMPELMSQDEFVGVEVDLFRPLEEYGAIDIKKAIMLARDDFTKRGKDWVSGIQLPLIQRFFFYYRLSPHANKIKTDLDFDRFKELALDKSRKIDLLNSLYVPDLAQQIKEQCAKREELITDEIVDQFEAFTYELQQKYPSLGLIDRFKEIIYRIIETMFLASNETHLTQETMDLIEKIVKYRETIINEKNYHLFEDEEKFKPGA